MLLYYASIAAAMVRLDQAISNLGSASLKRGMGWLITQEWLTDELRVLLNSGRGRLEAHGESSGEHSIS